jgi:hypothetical protein
MSELDDAIKPPEFKEQDEMFSDLDWHLYHADCGCIGTRDKKNERDRLKTIQTLFNFYREAAQRTAALEKEISEALDTIGNLVAGLRTIQNWFPETPALEILYCNRVFIESRFEEHDREIKRRTPPPTERGEG